MINLFFFPIPQSYKLEDIFTIKQGKNISSNNPSNKVSKSSDNVYLLTVLDFNYNFFTDDDLMLYNNEYSEKDSKYLLLETDFIVNRAIGTHSKTLSMLNNNNIKNKNILITQNFIVIRIKEVFSQIPKPYLHFLLKICIEEIVKEKLLLNDKVKQYITVKDVENFQIPTSLLNLNPENNELYKSFEKLNSNLNKSFIRVSEAINQLNHDKTEIAIIEKEYSKIIKSANESN